MKIILINLALIIIVLYGANRTSLAQTGTQQNPPPCRIFGQVGGKYKLLSTKRSNLPAVMLLVMIKPKNINREYLLEFVKRIRQEYCRETRLVAYIFDNEKDAFIEAVANYPVNKKADGSLRGGYIFSESKNLENIGFSTKRGNPIDEVNIDLKDGEPINQPSDTDK